MISGHWRIRNHKYLSQTLHTLKAPDLRSTVFRLLTASLSTLLRIRLKAKCLTTTSWELLTTMMNATKSRVLNYPRLMITQRTQDSTRVDHPSILWSRTSSQWTLSHHNQSSTDPSFHKTQFGHSQLPPSITSSSIITMDTLSNYRTLTHYRTLRHSSQTCSSSSCHSKLSPMQLTSLRLLKPVVSSQSTRCSSTTPPALALPTPTATPRNFLLFHQGETSSSPKEAGSAANAKTTTSKVAKSATDVRKPSASKTPKVCQLTCKSQWTTRTPRGRPFKRLPQRRFHVSRSHPRELVTGAARGASTTTSLLERRATCATWAKMKVVRSCKDNNKIDTSNSNLSNHNNNIAKPKYNKPQSKRSMRVHQLGSRHLCQVTKTQKFISSDL